MSKYIDTCEAAIVKALDGAISIEEFHDEMLMISDAIESARIKGEDPKAAATRVSNDLIRSAERNAMIQTRNAYKNKLIEKEAFDQIDAAMKTLKGKDRLFNAIRSIISGLNTPFEGSHRSAYSMTQALKNEYMGGLLDRLDKDGVLTTWQKGMNGDMETQVAAAIRHLNTKDAVGETPRLLTMTNAQYTEAVKIAKVLVDMQEKTRLRLNRAGADVPKLSGFIGHQVHDDGKMLRAGYEGWKAKIEPLLDWGRMSIPATRREDFLKSAYGSMTTGVRKELGAPDPLAEGFKGPANLARSLSHSRQFHFKDADAWLKYSRDFGAGDLRQSVIQDLIMSAKNVGVLERMSTNPEAMLDGLITKTAQLYRDTDPDAVRELNRDWSKRQLHSDLAVTTGAINIGSHTNVARTGEWLRAIKTVATLGGSFISALTDVVFNAVNRMHQGQSVMGAWNDAFLAPFMRMGSKERMEVSRLLGAGLEMQTGAMLSRFTPEDFTNGETSGLMTKFFKLNLLGPWTDAVKSGATMILSADFAASASRAFNDLPFEQARMLSNYGIDEKQWDVIRQAARKADDGNDYILPGDIEDVTGSVFTGMSKFQQDRLKELAKENLFVMYSSEADFAAPTPGAREQSMLKQGTTPDSAVGQALRMFTQFKAFPITALTKVGGRAVHGGGSNMQMINLVVGSMVAGIAVAQLKEMMKGREPLPMDKDLFLRGALQGGALGIYGDLLLNRHSEYGGNVFSSLAGPVPNDIAQILELAQNVALDGDFSSAGRDAVQLLKGNTPGANLFYTKMVTDYLIFYQLQELVNPGYTQRLERNLRNRTGQEYMDLPLFGTPGSTVSHGGGFQ